MSRKNKKTEKLSSESSPPNVYYPFLDGFRGIAIIMILLHHIRRALTLDYLFVSNPPILKWVYFEFYELFGINLTEFYKLIQYVISQLKGILGIEVFFVISGFLIARILLRKNIDQGSVVRFYQRRFFRIYPNYVLMVLISMVLFESLNHGDIMTWMLTTVYHLLFLQNYFPLNAYLAHTWSMVVLEQFYFFCPLIILLVNFLIPLHLRRGSLIGICLFNMLLGIIATAHYLISGHPFLSWPITSPTPYWTISYHLDSLSFGCLLALLEPYWSQWKKSKLWGAALWLAGIMLFFILYFELDWSYYWGPWYLYSLGYVAIGLLFFAAYHDVSLFVKLRFFQWVGRHSYGIYIWHYLVLEFWKVWIGTIPPTLIILFSLVSCIGVGVVSSSTIEKYFLSFRKKVVPSI